ncbi:heme o synthase [Natrarchaeobius sp. A-rgal3]|uniref:heme o synthase n=1 Tax=Natrarchaeobius versutus TaxID=1679078 RepID=UPI00350F292E
MNRPSFTSLLLWLTVGTYLLVALGAAGAGTSLPASVTVTHHATAVVVGVLLVGVAIVAWTQRVSTPVRYGVTLALVLYPVQAAVGYLLAGSGTDSFATGHLLGGVAIFVALLLALTWHLDSAEYRSTGSSESDTPTPLETVADLPEPATGPAERAGPTSEGVEASSAETSVETTESRLHALGRTALAYAELMKLRLAWLLCLLALAGMGLATATGTALEGLTVVTTLTAGILAIGASGTFNHVYERNRDRKMSRTADRPVVTDRVSPRRAFVFGLGLAIVSLALMVALVNALAALLTAAAIVYYSLVYTVMLKPNTTWNIAIGGGSGALPALIGWAAVTGGIGLPAIVLAAIVVLWTPAHFYNLAIAHVEDYAAGGYPMLPVVRSVDLTRRRILYSMGATLLATVVLIGITDLGSIAAVVSALFGGAFVWTVARQYREADTRAAYRSFHASNAYLGALLVVVLLEFLVL